MTPEQLILLRDAIAADPALSAQPMNSDGAFAIAEAMNVFAGQAPAETMITARTVLAQLGMAGAVALDKLEAAAPHNSVVKWAIKFLTTDGLDVGHPTSQSMLDQLAAANVLTAAEASSLKALALQPQTRAEALLAPWRGRVSYQDVERARVLTSEVTA
ncbi:MAG: hypothetical protein RLZZ555_2088 [Pseudomonadota bacterium]|jgi:hypothetical protein